MQEALASPHTLSPLGVGMMRSARERLMRAPYKNIIRSDQNEHYY